MKTKKHHMETDNEFDMIKYKCKRMCIPSSQSSPKRPIGQVQVKAPLTPLVHVPPFWHGAELQGVATWQLMPWKRGGQLQAYEPLAPFVHDPPLRQGADAHPGGVLHVGP